MKVLAACEESQEVCKAFRELGHEAYSCDIQECSGGHPEWHIKADALYLLDGHTFLFPQDRSAPHSYVEKWDMIIAFPPCTYLTVTGNRWFNVDRYGDKAIQRYKDRENAINFLCVLSMQTATRLLLKILLVSCQQYTESLTRLSTLICLGTLNEKQLVYG